MDFRFAGTLVSRYETLDHEKPEHFKQLQVASDRIVDSYISIRPQPNTRSDEDLVSATQAHYALIGFTSAYECPMDTWLEMGDSSDPFVVATVEFIKAERQKALEVDTSDGFIFPLIALAMSHIGPIHQKSLRPDKMRVYDIASIAAMNDLIIILAKQIAEEKSITPTLSTDEYMDTGVPYYALVAAAKIFHTVKTSYPIERLTEPTIDI